jgi:disulfide bond formation protein DsbB
MKLSATFPSETQAITLTALVSTLLIAGAHIFQFAGYEPCDLCLQQRTPHWVNMGLGAAALVLLWRGFNRLTPLFLLAMAGALSVTAGIAAYHVGVEQKWWEGPTGCSAGGIGPNLSLEEMLAQIENTTVVPCDQVTWSLFGVSMAGYNFLISTAAALFALWALSRMMRNGRKNQG